MWNYDFLEEDSHVKNPSEATDEPDLLMYYFRGSTIFKISFY